jgi:hypothetical protein
MISRRPQGAPRPAVLEAAQRDNGDQGDQVRRGDRAPAPLGGLGELEHGWTAVLIAALAITGTGLAIWVITGRTRLPDTT